MLITDNNTKHMSTIQIAQAARAEKSLQKLCNIKGKIMTRQSWIENAKANGGRVEIGQTAKVQYNRTKYNRMTDWREQEEYMNKCNEMKIDYRLYDMPNDDSFYSITKTEYDYFLNLPDNTTL